MLGLAESAANEGADNAARISSREGRGFIRQSETGIVRDAERESTASDSKIAIASRGADPAVPLRARPRAAFIAFHLHLKFGFWR